MIKLASWKACSAAAFGAFSTSMILRFTKCSQSTFSTQQQQLFNDFKKEHGKTYPAQEEAIRFNTFKQNIELINKLNQDASDTAEYGITRFSDMTQDEFASQVLMPPTKQVVLQASKYLGFMKMSIEAPDNFDWRDHGAVTDVKDSSQNNSSSWIFSTADNIEGQLVLAGGNELTELSVQKFIENAHAINSSEWHFLAFDLATKIGNPKSTSQNTMISASDQLGTIQDWKAFSSDEDSMKQQLTEVGPLSVLLNASNLQFYQKGILSPSNSKQNELNHAALLVGYGVDKETGVNYWNVKNNWGKQWGEQGYFKMKRGVAMCSINQQVTTAIVDASAAAEIYMTYDDGEQATPEHVNSRKND